MQTLLLAVALTGEPINTVGTVEINTFGADRLRTALIYCAADGAIVDWRWYTDPQQIPRLSRGGWYIAIWSDVGKPMHVRCRAVIHTRTAKDVELMERAKLPQHKRRKLIGSWK